MSDLVERLRKPSDSEETMSHWDTLRAYLLKGGRGSYARDIFEAILGHIDEEREEAADRISALEREVEGLKVYAGEKSNQYVAAMKENAELRASIDYAVGVLDNYADPTGYTDGYGELLPDDAVQHEGLLAKEAATKLRAAIRRIKPSEAEGRE